MERGLAQTPLSELLLDVCRTSPSKLVVGFLHGPDSIAALKNVIKNTALVCEKSELRLPLFDLADPQNGHAAPAGPQAVDLIWVHDVLVTKGYPAYHYRLFNGSRCIVCVLPSEPSLRTSCLEILPKLRAIFGVVIVADPLKTGVEKIVTKTSDQYGAYQNLIELPGVAKRDAGDMIQSLSKWPAMSLYLRLLGEHERVVSFAKYLAHQLKAEAMSLGLQLQIASKRYEMLQTRRAGTGRIEWIEGAKKGLEQTLADVQESLENRRDQVLQPLSPMMVKFRERARSLEFRDLSTKRHPGETVCYASPEHINSVTELVIGDLKRHVEEDLQNAHDRLTPAITKVEKQVHAASGLHAQLTLELPSLRELWGRVENLISFTGDDNKFVIKRRGFFDLLTAGRQKVFVIIMMVSLLGRFGLSGMEFDGSLTKVLNVAFVVILVGIFTSGSVSAWPSML